MEKHEYEITSYGYSKKAQAFLDLCEAKQHEWAMNTKAPEFVNFTMELGWMVAGFAAARVCNPLARVETTRVIVYK